VQTPNDIIVVAFLFFLAKPFKKAMIVNVAFFAAKPLKKAMIIVVTFFVITHL
jgi:hypothetical protein